ncbi:MAG: polysaccharide biosynthesis C-terminal domain-containing protein [Haloarculaceae archaeon]
MNLPRAISKTFGVKVLNRAVSLVAMSIFAHELGASVLGTYFLLQMLLNVLELPADWGLKDGVEKRMSEGEQRANFLGTGLALKAALLVVPSTVVYLFRGPVNDYLGAELAGVFVVLFVVNTMENFTVKVLRGELKVEKIATLQFVRHYVRIGVGLGLVVLGYGLDGLVAGLLVSSLVVLTWGWYERDTPVGRPTIEHARSLIEFAKYDFVGSIGGRVDNWLDTALIGLLLSPAAVGAYEVAWRISNMATMLSGSVRSSMFPQISAWSANDASEEIESAIPDLITVSLLFVVPALFGSLLLADRVLGLVFGPEFVTAALVLVVLMGEKTIKAPHTVFGPVLTGTDRPDLAARAVLIAAGLNFVLNVVFIQRFGIVGAAIATLLATATLFVLRLRYLRDVVTIAFPIANVRAMVLAATGMFALLWVALRFVSVDTIPKLFVTIGTGAVLYVVFVFTAGSIRDTLGTFVREATE